MSVNITFLGAANTVTGSKYMVQHGDERVLVDCGLFQGEKRYRLQNWDTLPVEAASIDAVLLTHAHLDHCGYLPRLVKEGFSGPVYVTYDTGKLMSVVLPDSGRLLEEEAQRGESERGQSTSSQGDGPDAPGGSQEPATTD